MIGTVKFIGELPTEGGKEMMVGIKLGEGSGECDGTYEGTGEKHFSTEPGKGTYVPIKEIRKVIKPESLLESIYKLNTQRKNNTAEISRLKDELQGYANAPVPSMTGAVQKTEGDSDPVIKKFLEGELRKKWYLSVQDLCYRYQGRSENEVVNIYNNYKREFNSMPDTVPGPHSRIVYTVASSQKDNMVASGSDDKSIRLWRRPNSANNASQKEMRCIAELKLRSCINSIAFHPNQDMLAAALDSGWIELYDLSTGKMMGALEGQSTSEVWTVCFSPDGNNILSGSLDRAIRVWDVRERECKWALRGHDEWVNGIAVSSNGTTIVSGSGDKTVRVWDTKTMSCRTTLRGHEDFVRSVCVTADSSKIVSASDDCTLRVWNLNSGSNMSTIKAHSKGIYCVSASKTGQVVSSSRDFSVKVWDVSNNSKPLLKTFKEHRGDVNSCCFFDQGRWVASCSDDKKVYCAKV